MTDQRREAVGVASAVVLLMLMLVICNDGAGPAPTLSHPAPAALSAPVLHPFPWDNMSLSFDSGLCRPELSQSASTQTTSAPEPERHGLRKLLADLARKHREQNERNCDPDRVPEPPMPDDLRRCSQPVQFGIKF